MTEFDIIKALAKSIDDRKFPFQCSRAFIYGWESDYWSMTESGETREFEIKISRADYFADAKKEKHIKQEAGANYFYYVVPEGLIKKEEVDQKYGLIYIVNGRAQIEKKPRRLNSNEFTRWKMLASKFYWKYQSLWRAKYIDKEITREEYYYGLNLDLNEEIVNESPQN